MQTIYTKRREKLTEWMAQENIAAVFFHDSEANRTPAVRYFSGMPTDAIFMLAADGSNVLCAWDDILANKIGFADTILPYATFGRNPILAVKGMLQLLQIPLDSKVEIPSFVSYPLFLHYVNELADYNVICRESGVTEYAETLRAIKDEHEIECIRKASEITNDIIEIIEQRIADNSIKTESDVALLIEKECRKAGCEGTSFETLAAGPTRSYGIHCFPSYTSAEWPAQGLSILDFGIIYDGYTSDVTLTVAKGPLTDAQEKQLELVEKAYNEALKLYKVGEPIYKASQKVDKLFAKHKRNMPHSLGHGYGLQVHEWPSVRTNTKKNQLFEAGMVVTLEPGLYDEQIGGCRLENDILIAEEESIVLTKSKIIRID